MANNSLAVMKKDVVDVVQNKIQEFIHEGQLDLPRNYSVSNALKSAWLILQKTKNKDGKPVLEVCTKESIANSLLEMVLLGLNPAKEQCYFIAYGTELSCHPSYFGMMNMARECAGVKDFYSEVVYKGDEFEYQLNKGHKRITKHVQRLENIDPKNIVAAYCIVEFADDRPDYTEIMTIDQIRQAWAQGRNYKPNGNGTHQLFSDQMCKKTVTARACKVMVKSSSDSNLVINKVLNDMDQDKAEEDVEDEIAANANSEVIDIDPSENGTGDEPQEEQPESEPKPAANKEQQAKSNGKKQEKKQQSFAAAAAGPGF